MPWTFMGPLLGAAILVLLVFRVRRAAAGILALTVVSWSIVGWIGYPVVTDLRSGRPIMDAFSARLPVGADPGLIVWKEQFLLYLDRPVTHFGYRRAFEDSVADGIAWLAADPARVALVDDDHGECFDTSRAVHLGYAHRDHWYLVGYDAVDPSCGDGRDQPELAVKYVPPRRAD